MMRTSDRNALVVQMQFAVRHGLPIETMTAEITAGKKAGRRFIRKLQSGAGLHEALPLLGIRGPRAALLSLCQTGIDAGDALDLAEASCSMESDFRRGVVHALFYPCMLMILTLFSWFYLAALGILLDGRLLGILLLPAAFLPGLCVLFLLPHSMALKIRWTRTFGLLADAHVLFGILELMIRNGTCTAQALLERIQALDLREAAGRDALRDLPAGRPLSEIVSRMPAARIIAGFTPREGAMADFARLMKTEAAHRHERKSRKLFLTLHVLGLLLAGAAVTLLAGGVYMNVYGKGVPW